MVKLSTPRPVKAAITYPSRALGTNYQNTTGRPLVVIVSAQCTRANAAAQWALIVGYVKASSPADTAVVSAGLRQMDNVNEIMGVVIIFVVPNNYYYNAAQSKSALSDVALLTWAEVEL